MRSEIEVRFCPVLYSVFLSPSRSFSFWVCVCSSLCLYLTHTHPNNTTIRTTPDQDEMRSAVLSGSNTIRPYLVLRVDREDIVNSAIHCLAMYEVGGYDEIGNWVVWWERGIVDSLRGQQQQQQQHSTTTHACTHTKCTTPTPKCFKKTTRKT